MIALKKNSQFEQAVDLTLGQMRFFYYKDSACVLWILCLGLFTHINYKDKTSVFFRYFNGV